jgi:hypothetical protein
MKPKILVLCGTMRDERELSRSCVHEQYELIFEESSKSWIDDLCNAKSTEKAFHKKLEKTIEYFCTLCKREGISGIISSLDYPISTLRVAITEKLGLPGPSLSAVLQCEHKYYCRLLQQKHTPDAVPFFSIIHDAIDYDFHSFPFPLILKPLKSSFSRNAVVVYSTNEFESMIDEVPFPPEFLKPFNYLIRKNTDFEYDGCGVIAESFIDGYQTTVDGLVFQGEVTILGVIDSLFFPGTISFSRFEYPSSLEKHVQERMVDITKRIVAGSGLDNTLFNVECIYNPITDEVFIVEINPRISSQFGDLFERVDGFNTYDIMLDLSVGKKPIFNHGKGMYAIAASCVLRTFQDCYVLKIPSMRNIKRLQELFPDMYLEIYAQPGKRLSDEKQDGKSFRYALIHLGAYDREDLLNRFEICNLLLDFKFVKI